jgi:hypothetical protein
MTAAMLWSTLDRMPMEKEVRDVMDVAEASMFLDIKDSGEVPLPPPSCSSTQSPPITRSSASAIVRATQMGSL